MASELQFFDADGSLILKLAGTQKLNLSQQVSIMLDKIIGMVKEDIIKHSASSVSIVVVQVRTVQ